jgi:hypothetical protein
MAEDIESDLKECAEIIEEEPSLKGRLISAAVLVVVCTVIGGCVGGFTRYYDAFFSDNHAASRRALKEVENDTARALKVRIYIGAGVGCVLSSGFCGYIALNRRS